MTCTITERERQAEQIQQLEESELFIWAMDDSTFSDSLTSSICSTSSNESSCDNSVLDDEDAVAAADATTAGTSLTTVKSLTHIMQYYRLKKKPGMTKEDRRFAIATFEADPANVALVRKRKYMWYCLAELHDDAYFKSFMAFAR